MLELGPHLSDCLQLPKSHAEVKPVIDLLSLLVLRDAAGTKGSSKIDTGDDKWCSSRKLSTVPSWCLGVHQFIFLLLLGQDDLSEGIQKQPVQA